MVRKQFGSQTQQRTSILTLSGLSELGMGRFAYIKKLNIGGIIAFSVLAANGDRLFLAPCHKIAETKVKEAGLELVDIH